MKRIITCSDGTWNTPNEKVRTNVQKIFDLICKRDANQVLQIKFYDEGIGAQGGVITRTLNGATGKGIDDNIKDIYKCIVWNYEPGDEIYLFGFSRGAYTARSLAGLIRKCGILKKSDLKLITKAYDLYRNREAGPESDEAKKFRSDNSFEIANIKFIGVWDTVGSLWIPVNAFQWYNKKKYSFYDTTLSSIIDNAYHAISIDEERSNFQPTLWQQSPNASARAIPQVLQQKWFAGVHSNVGGGYPDEGLADIALKWIIDKARETGLAFDEEAIKVYVKPNHEGELCNSRTGIFALTPGRRREIGDDGIICDTVYDRMKKIEKYRPKNVREKKVG
jgi:uncharacterized protein (DUF2235 family)